MTLDPDLTIGLVNNMPQKAAPTTEQQFRSLLSRAAQKRGMRLRFFSLPACPLRADDRESTVQKLENLELLRSSRLDAMIVTGAEPQVPNIVDEPIWPAMARLIDWADRNTISTVWSCLAAHAAAYRLDSVSREILPRKLAGVYECVKTAGDHEIMWDAPAQWCVPHSRYNDLREDALLESGYRVISRIPSIGADMAVKQSESLFVLVQGHPEYRADSLYREYRRDIRRFLVGERDIYPDMPEHYFDLNTETALTALKEHAARSRDPQLLARFDETANVPSATPWSAHAVSFYAGWLSCVAQRKSDGVTGSRRAHS